MLFASLVYDRMPLQWNQLPFALIIWLQNAGGVAACGIAVFLLARVVQRDPDDGTLLNFPPRLRFLSTVLRYAIIASSVGYILLILQWLGAGVGIGILRTEQAMIVRSWISLLSGFTALLVVLTPIAIDLVTRIYWGRIWAIARLSWKEAVRGRVVWVFGSMALVFLFAEWFLPSNKAEDQIRNYVSVVYLSIAVLFLITAGLLGSFSIPNDVKSNSIHTIVTKPVEKFEIVLGRFLGYGAILTVGLFVVSCLSLIYVERGVNEDAQQESYKARVPLYGTLHFTGKNAQKADSVGREWGYRSYITGPTKRSEGFRQFAIWDFAEIPASVLKQTDPVRFEYAFDIFRLSKGEEGVGVHCTFTFVDFSKFASADPNLQSKELEIRANELRKKRNEDQAPINKRIEKQLGKLSADFDARKAGQDATAQKELHKQFLKDYQDIEDKKKQELETLELSLIKEYRIYQVTGQEVTDQHTQNFRIPAAFLKALVADNAAQARNSDNPQPALRAFVSVDLSSQSQMVGVAMQDFYLLETERPFWLNFLKGVVGMWFTHMLVLGVALAMSTYFSSVISLLSTLFLIIAGLCIDYLREVAEKRVDGGGPLESIARIGNRMPIAVKLEASPTTSLILSLDGAFSWWIGFILNLIPDVSRYDLHQYVANGFDIGWLDILFLDNTLPLLGYMAPWAILAYYLMKLREIANPT